MASIPHLPLGHWPPALDLDGVSPPHSQEGHQASNPASALLHFPHPHPGAFSGPCCLGAHLPGCPIFWRPLDNEERQGAGALRCRQPLRLLRPGSNPSSACLPQNPGGFGAVRDLHFLAHGSGKARQAGRGWGLAQKLGVSHEPQSLVTAEPVIQTILTLQ